MDIRKRHAGDGPAVDPIEARKKLKTSDLPLTQNKRSAIESILHTFKKKGEFDVLRKKAFTQFENGVRPPAIIQALSNCPNRTPKQSCFPHSRSWASLKRRATQPSSPKIVALPLHFSKVPQNVAKSTAPPKCTFAPSSSPFSMSKQSPRCETFAA